MATGGGASSGGGTAAGGGTATGGGAGGGTVDAGIPWWDPAFAHRYALTISNNSGATLPIGFQVGWEIDVDALVGAGNNDQLRLVRWNGSSWTQLDRVIDDNSPHHEWVWMALTAPIPNGGTDTSNYIYYGNPAAGPAPASATVVFDFYDELSGTSLNAFWECDGGYTLANSELALDYNQTVKSVNSYPDGTAVDFRLREPTYAGRFWGGFQLANSWGDYAPWLIWIARNANGPNDIWPEYTVNGNNIWVSANDAGVDGTKHIYGIDRLASTTVYRYDDAVFDTHASSSFTDPLDIRFTNESGSRIYIGMIRTRQAAYPFPTVTNGPVEP